MEIIMDEQLNGPCCVLGAAMNLGARENRLGDLFQVMIAAAALFAFAALFIL